MGRLANTPSWGVLVWAPLERVREVLASFEPGMNYRTNNGWTAGFYMRPDDSANDEAAELLRLHGLIPVFRFDFSEYEFLSYHWDGDAWILMQEGDPDDDVLIDPAEVLDGVGLCAPCDDRPPDEDAARIKPLFPREAIVAVGMSLDEARRVAGPALRVEVGPRGPIIYQPDLNTRFAFWAATPDRVLEVKFYPHSGDFLYEVMKGEACLGVFGLDKACGWEPFLDSVDGDTDPAVIVEKLGIPRSFVERDPVEHEN